MTAFASLAPPRPPGCCPPPWPAPSAPPRRGEHDDTPTGRYQVLRGIDVTVKSGELVCVVGHSGWSKTALLKMVSDFSTPSEQSATLKGGPVRGAGPDRMVVFQG